MQGKHFSVIITFLICSHSSALRKVQLKSVSSWQGNEPGTNLCITLDFLLHYRNHNVTLFCEDVVR